jgi:hypothetical protein
MPHYFRSHHFMSHRLMPRRRLVHLLFAAVSMLPTALLANGAMPAPTAGVTPATAIVAPSKPIATREQLDAYLRDTPPGKSPFGWLTPGGQKRFLDSLVFHQSLGGFSTEDLRYDLTRDQAYALLRLFGAQLYAVSMDARTTPLSAGERDALSTLERSYDQLLAIADRNDDSTAPDLIRNYSADVAPSQTEARRHALGNRDVEFLFRAANLSFGRTGQAGYLADMRADFAELDRRHAVERPVASDLYDALVRTRRTDEARALLASHPILDRASPPLMRIGQVRKGQPSLWIANPARRELLRLRFNIRAPAQVIVLAATGCHFCHNAARDLERDPLLRDIFRNYGQWVAGSDDLTAFDAVRQWNHDYPDMRLGIAYSDDELPMLKHNGTPTFFFLDHGTVIATVVGWPDNGNLEAIRRGLRRIELLR